MAFKKLGEIALWKGDTGKGKPVLRGTLKMGDDKEMMVALWTNTSEHPKAPNLIGNVQMIVDDPDN